MNTLSDASRVLTIDDTPVELDSRVLTIDTPAELDAAIATLVVANIEDPVIRWILDTPLRMTTYAPQLFRVLVTHAFEAGALQRTEDGFGVACWRPPGTRDDDSALDPILHEACAPEKLAQLAGVTEHLEHYRPPGLFWYLSGLGVDPIARNRGRGATLLRARLAECDALHLSAYLWSSNERNVPFYERHGFEARATLRIGACPPMIPMVRSAR